MTDENTYSTTTGAFFADMWTQTVDMYPKLAVIKCNHTAHAILASASEEAQDRILQRYLQENGLQPTQCNALKTKDK